MALVDVSLLQQASDGIKEPLGFCCVTPVLVEFSNHALLLSSL